MNCALVGNIAAINCSLAMNNKLIFWSSSAMFLLWVCHKFCSQNQRGPDLANVLEHFKFWP